MKRPLPMYIPTWPVRTQPLKKTRSPVRIFFLDTFLACFLNSLLVLAVLMPTDL